jgi:hypothetical protein
MIIWELHDVSEKYFNEEEANYAEIWCVHVLNV